MVLTVMVLIEQIFTVVSQIVHPNMKILPLFNPPHAIHDIYDF